jgi:hypothetical protein
MEVANNSVGPAAGIPAYLLVDSQDPDCIVPFWCAVLGMQVGHFRDGGHLSGGPAGPGYWSGMAATAPDG